MKGVVRLNDQFSGICLICSGHPSVSGYVYSASTNVVCNGRGVARHEDVVLASCGHYGIIQASGKPLVNTRKIALIGDEVAGNLQGNIITASTDFGEN